MEITVNVTGFDNLANASLHWQMPQETAKRKHR